MAGLAGFRFTWLFPVMVLLLGYPATGWNQQVMILEFRLPDNGKTLSDSILYADSQGTLQQLRFYISHLRLIQSRGKKIHDPVAHHLIDFSRESSLTIAIPIPRKFSPDSLVFTLGVDSGTQVVGVRGGDLDPRLGMYWSWQTGYINIKMEGEKADSSGTQKHFEYHLGGYASPWNSVREAQWACTGNRMVLQWNWVTFMQHIPGTIGERVMSPGRDAIALTDLFIRSFSTVHE